MPWLVMVAFIAYDLYYFVKGKKKKDIFAQIIILVFVEVLLGAIFWFLPFFIFKEFPRTYFGFSESTWMDYVIVVARWGILIGIAWGVVYVYGHEHGEKRWRNSLIAHLGVLVLGWLIHRWVGIFCISIPLILSYYSALYSLAMVVLPTANPDDKKEKWKRFIILVAYTWGIQFPILAIPTHAWKEAETRIKGDFTRDFPVPGLVWMKAHQVAGITIGPQFNRVDGPGLIFTGKLERPLQVFDLRLQVRNNLIDVVSKDGIAFKARVFTAFRIDPDSWDKDTYVELRRTNPLLRDADKPSFTAGSFPFSHRRIQAALSTASSKTGAASETWDQWVLTVVNDAARKVVSQKTLDEFWRPANDKQGANALDEIATEIKNRAFLTIRAAGILLVVARIVNFEFPSEGETEKIPQQQITTWSSGWERKRSDIVANAEAEAERIQQEARVYAEAFLLNSIVDGLQKTRELHPELPKYVIAMRFLSTLQDHLGNDESTGDLRSIEFLNYLQKVQERFGPGQGSEKGKR